MFSDDPDLLKKVITGDESWVCGYDIETKAYTKLNTVSLIHFFEL